MTDHELAFKFQDRLKLVPPPENAMTPGARTMIGSREEALHLLWAREYLWRMEVIPKSLMDRWEKYREFWDQKSIEESNSPEWL